MWVEVVGKVERVDGNKLVLTDDDGDTITIELAGNLSQWIGQRISCIYTDTVVDVQAIGDDERQVCLAYTHEQGNFYVTEHAVRWKLAHVL